MPKNMKLIIFIAFIVLIGYGFLSDFGKRSFKKLRPRSAMHTSSRSTYYPPDKPITSNHFNCKGTLSSSVSADAIKRVDSDGSYTNIISGSISEVVMLNINVSMDDDKLSVVYPQMFKEDSPGPEFTISKKDKHYLTAVSYEREGLNTTLFTINLKTGKALWNQNMSYLRTEESPAASIKYLICEDI